MSGETLVGTITKGNCYLLIVAAIKYSMFMSRGRKWK